MIKLEVVTMHEASMSGETSIEGTYKYDTQ